MTFQRARVFFGATDKARWLPVLASFNQGSSWMFGVVVSDDSDDTYSFLELPDDSASLYLGRGRSISDDAQVCPYTIPQEMCVINWLCE